MALIGCDGVAWGCGVHSSACYQDLAGSRSRPFATVKVFQALHARKTRDSPMRGKACGRATLDASRAAVYSDPSNEEVSTAAHFNARSCGGRQQKRHFDTPPADVARALEA